jgi:hypothetical protein
MYFQSYAVSLRAILILSSQVSAVLEVFHQIPVRIFLLSIRATCPAQLILLDCIIQKVFIDEYKS